jgi:hypothetical protein
VQLLFNIKLTKHIYIQMSEMNSKSSTQKEVQLERACVCACVYAVCSAANNASANAPFPVPFPPPSPPSRLELHVRVLRTHLVISTVPGAAYGAGVDHARPADVLVGVGCG